MEERKLVHEDEWLYRRSWLPERKFLNPDGSATSRVFKLKEKDNGELSVDVKSMTTANIAVLDKGNFFLFPIALAKVLGMSSKKGKNLEFAIFGLKMYKNVCQISFFCALEQCPKSVTSRCFGLVDPEGQQGTHLLSLVHKRF